MFIAGMDGYLGWSLAQHLARRGHEVAGADALFRRSWVEEMGSVSAIPIATADERLRAMRADTGQAIPFWHGDLRDYDLVQQIFREFEPAAVIHLGECPSAPYSMIDREHTTFVQLNNLTTTFNLLFAIRDLAPDAHLLKVGAMGESGPPDADIPEIPSWYHWSKIHGSNNVMFACQIWGIRATEVMQGVVFGSRTEGMGSDPLLRTRLDFDPAFGTVINRFSCQAVIEHTLTPHGAGGQVRGFLPLRDSMQGLTLCLEHPPKAGEYRVFSQFAETYCVRSLAEVVRRAALDLGLKVDVAPAENPRAAVERGQYHSAPDHDRLLELGYQPTRDVAAEVRAMLEDLLPHRERIAEHEQALLPSMHRDGSRYQMGFLGGADERAAAAAADVTVGPEYLPFHRPSIEEEDVVSVSRVLRSGWLTQGPVCREFEAEFAANVGASRAVALSSCTAALHLALVALDIGPGDEVIVPPFTFCASAHVIEHAGATPVFADIDPITMQIDPVQIERVLGARTKAIIAVDYGGHPCGIEEIVKMARVRGVAVIEDAAHSLGAAIGDRLIGSIADVTAFSFYATKNITTGEGGMLTTADHRLADRVERLRLHGMERDAWRRYQHAAGWHYEVSEAGFKANMTDFQAALGRSQLCREPAMRARRTTIAGRYSAAFAALGDLVELPTVRDGVRSAWHLYPLRVAGEARNMRDQLAADLDRLGIGTSVHFAPLHLSPHYRQYLGFRGGEFPVSEDVSSRVLSLPLYPAMSWADVERVVGATLSLISRHAR
jgi:UDP-sulfoquinovose synthase